MNETPPSKVLPILNPHNSNSHLTLEQTLQDEIKDSQRWIEIERHESPYKRDFRKREN